MGFCEKHFLRLKVVHINWITLPLIDVSRPWKRPINSGLKSPASHKPTFPASMWDLTQRYHLLKPIRLKPFDN